MSAQAARGRLPWALKLEDDRDSDTLGDFVKKAVSSVLSTVTGPFRLATSKPAQKLYLTSAVFFIASVVLLTISSIAYSIFYYNYIPQISLDEIVYLQFADDAHPSGITSLRPRILTTDQAYDVAVSINLPRTSQNLQAASILTLESDELQIPMFEDIIFEKSGARLPSYARLEVQTLKHVQTLQVYNVAVHFRAKFTGLKYIVYNYRIISFLVFTSIFYITSVATMSFAWFIISMISWLRQESQLAPEKSKLKLESSTPTASEAFTLKAEPQPDEGDETIYSVPQHSPMRPHRRETPLRLPSTGTELKREPSSPPLPQPTDSEDTTLDPPDALDYDDKHDFEDPRGFDSGLGTSIAAGTTTTTAADDPEDDDLETETEGIGIMTSSAREWEGETPNRDDGTSRGRSTGRSSGNRNEGTGKGDDESNGLTKRKSRIFDE
ncbi:putative adipose-regulatory protein [Phaeomoniella chlamydospora]|uniref:Putative adipose-regulatory protein n=1 Tax=Phaeomoniella chlamydospora TaxID=158046 RepID=A0A0G2HE07_PHACM|nr:putative adipose-regulatory protein [Phaeomoniella chlamydospora]